MRVVIFANGVLNNERRARKAAEDADLVVAANGGALHCRRLGLTPALIVGDLDSLDEDNRKYFEVRGTEFITHPPDKDQTDLELALLAAVDRHATIIAVLGAAGGRFDMTLANVQLLALPDLRDILVELWHDDQTARLIRPPGGPIEGVAGDGISLIPIGGAAHNIQTQDLEYPLNGEHLEVGPARGVSNVISGPDPRIALESGLLLAIHTPGSQSNA